MYETVASDVKRRPLLNFFLSLLVLLLIMGVVRFVTAPKEEKITKTPSPKIVTVYHIGTSPMLSFPAKIEKSGVIAIVAQTAGVIQSVNVTEGDTVGKGKVLLDIATNYQGASAPDIQAQIAQKQFNNMQETFDFQKDLIEKQRTVATTSAQNTEELRKIADKSLGDTRDLISLNQDIIDALNKNIDTLSNANTNGSNDQFILQAKQLKSQFQSGLNQLRSLERQTSYQTNTDNPPTQLANLQKDITLKQLDLQGKALELNKEVSALQLNLAYVSASLMHPASPVAATVERVHITVGQAITPGTVLVTLSAADPDVTAVVSVPNQIAATVSRVALSTLHIGNKTVTTIPRYVSTEATNTSLYTILYSIPPEYQNATTNASYITVDVPLALPNTTSAIPFVPIDAVYQTQSDSYIYVISNGKAKNKSISLGDVYGNYVAVNAGLQNGDQVILDRNVIAGDSVTEKK